MMATEVPLMKAPAVAAVVAVLAFGIGFCAGVTCGRSCDLREPAAEPIRVGSPPALAEPGDQYERITTQALPPADFQALTAYAGRRNSR